MTKPQAKTLTEPPESLQPPKGGFFFGDNPRMDLFGTATLRHPVWYSDSVFDERALPLSVGDYKITPGVGRDGRWTVTSSKGDVVYNGIGPVTVVAA